MVRTSAVGFLDPLGCVLLQLFQLPLSGLSILSCRFTHGRKHLAQTKDLLEGREAFGVRQHSRQSRAAGNCRRDS